MQKWNKQLAIFLLILFSFPAYSEDGHCLKTTSQTSVDYVGTAYRTTCDEFTGINSEEVAKQKKKCGKGARKNKAKIWEPGLCPTKGRIGTCTATKIGPATLPKPIVIHTYEESGGNLSLEAEVGLARQQCAQLSLNSGHFVEVTSETKPVVKGNNSDTTKDSAQATATDQVQESHPQESHPQESQQEQSNEEGGAVNKGVSGVKKAWGSFKDKISK